MRFTVSRDGLVTIETDDTTMTFAVGEFAALEPSFDYEPEHFELWSADKRYLSDGKTQKPSPYDRSAYAQLERLAVYRAAFEANANLPASQPEPEPEADWDGFNTWMLTDSEFIAVCNEASDRGHGSMVSALFVAYTQVAAGKTNAFLITLEAVCAAGGATPEAREQWAAQAEAMHLPDTFVQIIKGNHE